LKTSHFIAIAFVFIPSLSVNGQDNMGIAGSNYAPANTVLVNPSSIVDSKAFIDVNFAGFGVYANNNLVYLPKSTFQFKPRQWASSSPEIAQNLERSNYYGLADVNIHGPSATFHVKKNAFGIYAGARSVSDARHVPVELVNFSVYGWDYNLQTNRMLQMNNVRVNSLNWAEFGLSFARIFKQSSNDLWLGGISVKRLVGIGGAGLILDNWTFMIADSTLTTYDLSGEYGFNYPAWNSGKGWGIDLGFTYKRTLSDVTQYTPFSREASCTSCDYQYKLAAALLDLGRIAFRPPYYTNELAYNDTSSWENFMNIHPTTAEGLNGEIENGMGLSDAKKVAHKIFLPAAISLQFDYNLGNNIFLNSTLIAGLPWKKSLGVQRGAQWSLTPRVEMKNFEFALPFVLHEWKYPSLGAMLRLRSIIIGTDKLGTFLFNQDVYGADLYVNVKYTLFKSFRCGSGREQRGVSFRGRMHFGKRTKGRKRGHALPCPTW